MGVRLGMRTGAVIYTPLPYVKKFPLLGEGLKFLEFLGASEILGGIS